MEGLKKVIEKMYLILIVSSAPQIHHHDSIKVLLCHRGSVCYTFPNVAIGLLNK